MDFRIADKFTDSLANLTDQEQKAVKRRSKSRVRGHPGTTGACKAPRPFTVHPVVAVAEKKSPCSLSVCGTGSYSLRIPSLLSGGTLRGRSGRGHFLYISIPEWSILTISSSNWAWFNRG